MECNGNRSLYLVSFVFPIQTTWRYSHCRCICINKLWKDGTKISLRALRDLLWIGTQSLHAEEFYYARVKWRYRCLELSCLILVRIDWTKTEGLTSENWEGNKEMHVFGSWLNCWMATPVTATRTLFPTSHRLDCEKSVLSPRNNREGEMRALAWESVDTRGEGIAGIPSRRLSSDSCACARLSPYYHWQSVRFELRVRSQP